MSDSLFYITSDDEHALIQLKMYLADNGGLTSFSGKHFIMGQLSEEMAIYIKLKYQNVYLVKTG